MRILFINRYFHPDTSGTSQMLTDLAEDLVRMGHSVSVLAGKGSSSASVPAYRRREVWKGIQIHRISSEPFSRLSVFGWVLNSLVFYPGALFRTLFMPRPDLAVFMSDPPLVYSLGPVLRRLKGCPYLCWSQDLYPEAAIGTGVLKRGSAAAGVLSLVSRWALKKAEAVVAVGEGMARRLAGMGVSPDKIQVIHNWADGNRIRPIPSPTTPFTRKYGLDGKFVVLYSGNMGLGNAFESLIGAAEQLRDHPDIRFVLIGGGKQYLGLLNRAGNWPNVRFLPFQKKESLSESLGAGHLHLVTLKPELGGVIVPSKLYAAMAAARAVCFIGPGDSESARIIRDGKFGTVIDPGEAQASSSRAVQKLLAFIRELHSKPEEARLMGERARKIFESRFERTLATRSFKKALERAVYNPAPESFLKRTFDLILSGAGLALSLPLWALFSILIKLEDGGPVFFPQARVGKGGRIFQALKFRSMVPDAEKKTGPVQAAYDDPRVTRIGRFLRATAMDELPQLWNIFRGDMSFVGPRALRPTEMERKRPGMESEAGASGGRFKMRHRIRPGLTGLAQIYAPRDATRSQKLRYDLVYFQSRSFFMDLRLILLSFWISFRGRWEARGQKV